MSQTDSKRLVLLTCEDGGATFCLWGNDPDEPVPFVASLLRAGMSSCFGIEVTCCDGNACDGNA